MLLKKRSLRSVVVLVILGAQVQAGPLGAQVAGAFAGSVGKIANTLTDKFETLVNGDSLVEISNSTLNNKVEVNDAFLFAANVGIMLNGKRVKISGSSELKNEVKAAKVTAAFTNLGISMNGNTITIKNSKIYNELRAEGATIIGGNAGIKLGEG